jgi:glycopeptide antibiotics resistance protein
MMTSFRIWIADLGVVDAVLAIALALALITVLNLRARRGARRPELLCTALFGAYLIVLAMVVLCPLPGLSPVPGSTPFTGSVGSEPPRFLISTTLHLRGFLGQGLANQNLQNLLLTVPFGLGLPFVVRWRDRWLVVACVVLPLILEGSQLLASLIAGWAYRSVDVNDYLANTAGALLGLALFTWAAWLVLLARPQGDAQRRHPARAAAASGVAVIAVAVALWSLGPAETTNYAHVCEGDPPANALRLLKDWTAYAEDGQLCLSYPQGSTASPAGSPDVAAFADDRGEVTVVGQAPAQTSRVVVTLPDGRSTEARLHPLDGLAGWLTFAARIDPDRASGTAITIDPATVRVESFTADGIRGRGRRQ